MTSDNGSFMDIRGRQLNPLVCSGFDLASELQKVCDWFTGVPDSMYKNVLPNLSPYTPSPRENHALAMAFGTRLGGKRPCVLMQNSGLGLSGDVLYGLFHLYRLGVMLVVAWRGELGWEEPQHHLWGKKTLDYLSVLDVAVFDFQELGLAGVSRAAEWAFERNQPAAILVRRGNIDE